MISHSLKRWLGGEASTPAHRKDAGPDRDSGQGILRHSNGLREFFAHIAGLKALKVLDLGAASQANINFITGLGHTIFHEDLYPQFAESHWNGDAFLKDNLNYTPALFDAVVCWDIFDQLPEPEAAAQIVARLGRITKAGGALVLFFHTAKPDTEVPVFRSQICGLDCFRMFPRGNFRLRRPLNNRNIENLFRDFHALKFFLARDHLREVVVVR